MIHTLSDVKKATFCQNAGGGIFIGHHVGAKGPN